MKSLTVLMLSLVMLTNCFAQKENKKDKKKSTTDVVVETQPQPQTPVDDNKVPEITEECLVNISLFNESAKNKQYADALAPWNAAYKACPNANKAIYIRGREILQWQLSQTKDEATYKQVFDQLMGMYDTRMKYFGDDAKYGTAWIKGIKALDYITYVKNDALKKPAYDLLEKCIDGSNGNVELEVLRQFIVLSNGLYKADPKGHTEKFIADYTKVNNLLVTISSNEADKKNADAAIALKPSIDALFAQSGAADCETLDKLYKDKIAENAQNLQFLNTVISFYKRVNCTKSNVYFAASEAVFKVQPTAESANGCAEMSYLKGEHSKAISYYEEATKLATDKKEKGEYQYKIAQLYYSEFNNFSRSREYARNSLEFNPNNGSAYLLIGIMYAKSTNIYDDPVLKKSVYWVAVDKFSKAKQVDPSIAPEANKLINTYSAYFPSKEDIFFQPVLQAGKSFTVGGWIGETTICR